MRGKGRVNGEGDKKREIRKEELRRVMRSLKGEPAVGSNGLPEEV